MGAYIKDNVCATRGPAPELPPHGPEHLEGVRPSPWADSAVPNSAKKKAPEGASNNIRATGIVIPTRLVVKG
jgi:hypothetical protein